MNADFNFENLKLWAVVEFEFPRKKQILEDSIYLIQSTNNLETIKGRYFTALEQANWIKKQISLGAKLFFEEEEEGFNLSLNRVFNFNINRIAQYNYNKQMEAINDLKSFNAKIRHKKKLVELLRGCKAVLKPHSNKFEIEKQIEVLINMI